MNTYKKAISFLSIMGLATVTTGCQTLTSSSKNVEGVTSTVVSELSKEEKEAERADKEESEETDEKETEVTDGVESEEKYETPSEQRPEDDKEEAKVTEDTTKTEQVTVSEAKKEKKVGEKVKKKEVKISSNDKAKTENKQAENSAKEKEKAKKEALKKETQKAEKTEKKAEENKPKENKKPEPKQITFNKDATIPVTKYLLPANNSTERTEEVTHVLVHFASSALLKPTDPYRVEDIFSIFKDYGVSAHYVIDRKGEIHLFVEEDRVAYHAGKGSLSQYPEYKDVLNYHSIGIELLAMGTREEMIPIISEKQFNKVDPSQLGYTDSQYTALKALIDDIIARYPSIKKDRQHVIGHDEYAPGRKTDPGSLFDWSKIGF